MNENYCFMIFRILMLLQMQAKRSVSECLAPVSAKVNNREEITRAGGAEFEGGSACWL